MVLHCWPVMNVCCKGQLLSLPIHDTSSRVLSSAFCGGVFISSGGFASSAATLLLSIVPAMCVKTEGEVREANIIFHSQRLN